MIRRAVLGLAAALALTGCAAGGAMRATAVMPATGGPGAVAAADGSVLPVSVWEAAEPRAVIVAVHGFGDYGPSTFAAAATDWAARGITTYAYDQRGFGRGPTRGVWPGAEGLVADAVAVTAQIRRRHPCTALVVVGHSMGGGVTLAAAAEGLAADAIVLAAPAIWGGDALNPLHRAAAWVAAVTVPERRISGRGIVRIMPSDNIELLRALGRDPYYLAPPSARELMGLVRVTDLAAAAAPEVRLPALMLLGAKDEIVPERAVRRVFDRLPGEREVILYPEGWHLLFRDLQAPRVWEDVGRWVLARPGPACGGAG